MSSLVDYEVDRRTVYALQGVEPTRTNRASGNRDTRSSNGAYHTVTRFQKRFVLFHTSCAHQIRALARLCLGARTHFNKRRHRRRPPRESGVHCWHAVSKALQNPGGSNDWATPVPIPNTAVKPVSADGTPQGGE